MEIFKIIVLIVEAESNLSLNLVFIMVSLISALALAGKKNESVKPFISESSSTWRLLFLPDNCN